MQENHVCNLLCFPKFKKNKNAICWEAIETYNYLNIYIQFEKYSIFYRSMLVG